ncbi:MAG: hypothetical protein CMJ46_13270 [Planctomyces sp.]|nr:hypothetical protein [Planctomyces sp.]
MAVNQGLWSLGEVLTGGAFLHYFIYDLDVSFKAISVVIALPELVGCVALFTRLLLQFNLGLKRIWMRLLFASRFVAMLIPCCLYWEHTQGGNNDVIFLLICLLAAAEMLQAFSYTAYLSWLSVLSPQYRWGELFAWKNIAKVAVLLLWATAVGLTRDHLDHVYGKQALKFFYIGCFLFGCLLQISSFWPLRHLPDPEVDQEVHRLGWSDMIESILRKPSLRWLLLHNWTLAFFNGLTQSVFYFYMRNILHTPLAFFFLLMGVMRIAQMPVSYYAGRACDRGHDKRMLLWGLLFANAGLFFWFPATAEQPYWLVLCYALWGFYGAANIGGQNLLLKYAASRDNTLHLAMFHRIAGALAGTSGLIGGWLLSEYFEFDTSLISDMSLQIFGLELGLGLPDDDPVKYHTLILLSVVGRYAALLLLAGVSPRPDPEPATAA